MAGELIKDIQLTLFSTSATIHGWLISVKRCANFINTLLEFIQLQTVIMCQYYMLTFLIKLLEPYCSKHQNEQRQFILRLKQTPTYGCGKRQQTGH